VRAPSRETYEWLQSLMRKKTLHTVCEEAGCPNMGECWGSGTATFLMLGDVCTRTCGFCDIKHGQPTPLDWLEPERVAQAVKAMELRHAVITSVNRDDRKGGGAPIFAMVIRRIRQLLPSCSVEVLIPDFRGSLEALQIVMDARPEILSHNVETVPRLFKHVQAQDPHAKVTLQVTRGGKVLQLSVALMPPMKPGESPKIGITIDSGGFSYKLPFPVTITSHQIVGGPSAGLMFTLTVYNSLSPVDLTHGLRIAGTGTINADGTVGPIGGIKQKVAAAEAAGAKYFLAPVEDYPDALTVAKHIKVVEVANVDQALAFLNSLAEHQP
jgi:hypothetical protein